jgi:DNA invertase Pin-like site-specific DNA recombinase
MLKGLTCAIYARVSSKSQLEGMSIEAQIEKTKAYAEQKGMLIKKIYSEDASARKPHKRKQFEAMVKAQSSQDKVDVIIFLLVDRMSRNPVDAYKLLEKVEKEGLILVFVNEALILKNPIKANEQLVLDMVLGVSNYRVNHDRDVCMFGTQTRAKTGFRPTKCPYGYRNPKGKHKTLISKNEADFVTAAFEMYSTGQYSLSTLPKALFDKGLRYKLQPSGIIPKQSLNSMLKNIFYTGKYTFTGSEGLIEGKHKAIVSDELFNKVQSILGEPSVDAKRYQHMYSKLIKCELCGNYMIGDKKVKPSGKEYVYYRCMNSKCPNSKGGTNQNDIDASMEKYLKEIRLDKIPKDIIQKSLKEALSDLKQRESTLKRNKIRKYHAELKNKEYIEENDIADIEYISEEEDIISSKYENLDKEIEIIEKQIQFITELVNSTFKKRLSEVFVTLPDFAKIDVIELIKNKLTLNDKKLKMTFKSAIRNIRKR